VQNVTTSQFWLISEKNNRNFTWRSARIEDYLVTNGTVLKVKVKVTLEQATKTHKGSRGITTLPLTSALDGVDGQRHAPTAFPR